MHLYVRNFDAKHLTVQLVFFVVSFIWFPTRINFKLTEAASLRYFLFNGHSLSEQVLISF